MGTRKTTTPHNFVFQVPYALIKKAFRKRQSKQPLQQFHIAQPRYKPAPQKPGKYATVRVFARPALQSSAPSPVTSSFFERLSNRTETR
jgi:hypothetical protein